MSEHLYEKITADLRDVIERRELGPGDRLPKETDLQTRYGASRNTVRRALAQMVREGLAVSKRAPKGYYVVERGPLHPFDYAAADLSSPWSARPEIVDAPFALAEAAGWPTGCPCVVRRTVDHPGSSRDAVHREVWVPLSVAQGTQLLLPTPPGTELELLQAAASVPGGLHADDHVGAVPVDNAVASALGIRPGSAATQIRTVWRDRAGHAVRVAVFHLPVGRVVTRRRLLR